MSAAVNRIQLLGTYAASVLTGVTAGTSQPIPMQGADRFTIYFRSVGTTSGGTVLIEEADWDPTESVYSGTWSQVASIAASSFTGGVQLAYHSAVSDWGFIRVRISSAITGGGTISVAGYTQGAA